MIKSDNREKLKVCMELATFAQIVYVNAFHAAGECRQQVKNFTIFLKMTTFWKFMTIFGITIRNAFK